MERLQHLLKEKDASLQREVDSRFAAEQRSRQQEAQCMQLTAQLQQAQQQTLALKKQLKDQQKQHDLAVRSKQTEVERLVRRNQVLNDTLSRMASDSVVTDASSARDPSSARGGGTASSGTSQSTTPRTEALDQYFAEVISARSAPETLRSDARADDDEEDDRMSTSRSLPPRSPSSSSILPTETAGPQSTPRSICDDAGIIISSTAMLSTTSASHALEQQHFPERLRQTIEQVTSEYGVNAPPSPLARPGFPPATTTTTISSTSSHSSSR